MSQIEEGVVYLIQPEFVVGVTPNRAKIGCSRKNDFQRVLCGQYGKGTRIIRTAGCSSNVFKLEEKIKERFNKNYKLIKGKEHFEGDEKAMIKDFNDVVDNYIPEDEEVEEVEEVEEEVKLVFPNYKEDQAFGGKKRLCKFDITSSPHCITSTCIDDGGSLFEFEYFSHDLPSNDFYNKLSKSIENDKVYNFDDKMIQKINKCKTKIKCDEILITDIDSTYITTETTIFNILNHDMILIDKNNDKEYNVDNVKNDNPKLIRVFDHHNYHDFKKINNVLVHKNYMIKNYPYCLDINVKSNEIYCINRDYEYSDFDTKCLNDIVEDTNNFKRIYLYNDKSVPYENKINYTKYIYNIKKACGVNEIINMNDLTRKLLTM